LRLLAASWKLVELDAERRDELLAGDGCIATLWHGRMLLPMQRHRARGLKVLVSPSGDGELMEKLLSRLGYGTIRGSTNRKPVRALREMLGDLREGATIVITPDGPRGPRHAMNVGPVWMAKATGFPILPCGFATDPAWRLSSWDRFTIPKPRARVALVYGEPMRVDPDTDDEGLRTLSDELRERMLDAERRGFELLGVESDH